MNDLTLTGTFSVGKTGLSKQEKVKFIITWVLVTVMLVVTLGSILFKTQVYREKFKLSELQSEYRILVRENRELEYRYSELVSVPNLKKWAQQLGMRQCKEGEYFVLRDYDE